MKFNESYDCQAQSQPASQPMWVKRKLGLRNFGHKYSHKKGVKGVIHVLCKHNWDQKLNTYSNKLPYKYHKSILGGLGVWYHVYFACLGSGGPEFWKTCLYNTWMLLSMFVWANLAHLKTTLPPWKQKWSFSFSPTALFDRMISTRTVIILITRRVVPL